MINFANIAAAIWALRMQAALDSGQFSNYAWYKPQYEAVDFDESSLSDTEKKNIETILAYEVSMGYR